MSNIFVFVPTGSIGSHVADQLAKKGIHFKAAARDTTKAEELKKKYGDLVEPVLVDFYDQDSLDAALKGIEKAFLGLPPGTQLCILLLTLTLTNEYQVKLWLPQRMLLSPQKVRDIKRRATF